MDRASSEVDGLREVDIINEGGGGGEGRFKASEGGTGVNFTCGDSCFFYRCQSSFLMQVKSLGLELQSLLLKATSSF